MITTTFAAIAMSAVLSTGAVTVPTWQTDYSKALAAAAADQKPVAVFIGKGEAGYAKLVGGEIPSDAGQLLAKNYVCVYVDTETPAGQKLAEQFDMPQGLVISGKGGNVQALRFRGRLTQGRLTGYLNKYSEVKTVVTTESAVEGSATTSDVVPAAFSTGGCPNGRCPGTVSYPTYSYSRRR